MSSTFATPASVVVITHNEGDVLHATVDAFLDTSPPGSEVIVVDDSSTDGSADFLVDGYHGVQLVRPTERLGALKGRNFGGARATRPFIVFADAHVVPPPGWGPAFVEALAEPYVAAVGPGISVIGRANSTAYGHVWKDPALSWRWLDKKSNDPYEVPMLPGAFYGLDRDVFEKTGGFDSGLLVWGTGDAELSLRLWLLGYRCLMVPAIDVGHQFKKAHNFELKWDLLLHNMLRTATVHLNQERLTQVVAAMSERKAFPGAFARLLLSDAWRRRDEIRSLRARDDDWYFEYFDINWPEPSQG